jgi:methylated-DNA-protein-cysteine methyltransferase related protein
MDEELVELIRSVISRIPEGRVATYGDIAALSRAPSPRMVGRVLQEDGHDLPWQRVLRADGTCAPHIADEQLQRLRAEGVMSMDGKVDLREYRWEEAAAPLAEEPQLGLFE